MGSSKNTTKTPHYPKTKQPSQSKASPLMKFAHIILFILMVSMTTAATYPRIRIAKNGCNDTCGEVEIPYPFGMTKGCRLDSSFNVTCDYSYNPPKAFVGTSDINITKISLEGQLNILKFVAGTCEGQVQRQIGSSSFSLDARFTINSTANKFTAVGCNTYAIAQGIRFINGIPVKQTIGCISICDNPDAVINGSCSGGGCCQTSIPKAMTRLNLSVKSYNESSSVGNFSSCSFGLLVEAGKFNFSLDTLTDLRWKDKLPMVIDWGIGDENTTCETARKDSTTYACQNNAHCVDGEGNYTGYRCICNKGYEGNPYLPNVGCRDIKECLYEDTNDCKFKHLCHELEGGYNCSCPKDYQGDGKGSNGCTPIPKKSHQILVAGILAGISLGTMVLLIVCSWYLYVSKKRKMLWLKEKFFRENGGLILQKRLNGQEESSNAPRIFTARGLEKATNNFHEGSIIGQGGFGIVYKGYLIDNKEVAIKKSKTVDPKQIEQFINEVMILSQVNHKYVVKLFGCCLETEVPLLVYEFINNGTLFNHLHNKNLAREIGWDIRLKIGAETAEALSYLHSAASPPIIHRDVKTMNILLDKEYTAKVSDFGASRLGPLNEDQLPTMVQGTRGYLDPEFFQTFQLTEKSDVYSFGVVLVELLTGKMPISFDRPEEVISLSNHFLSCMKENRLLEILEDFLVSDKNIDQMKQVAVLAERCLNVRGEDRPSMKEVAMELEGLRITSKHSWTQGSQAYNQEEIEPLIDNQEQSTSSLGGDIMLTTTYYNLENQEKLPIAWGR